MMKAISIKNTYVKRFISCAAAAAMLFSMSAVPSCAADSSRVNVKDETVYVVTESDGSCSDVIVSDHICNTASQDRINDTSGLKDIENVKGDEKFTRKGGDTIIWDAEGEDIYYQGKTERSLPVTMTAEYSLDGHKIKGSELAGKSGELRIELKYENRSEFTRGGRTVRVPFAVMAGMVVENDCMSDIKINSGKIIDDGEKTIIAGLAAPGLAESIGMSEEEAGLGSSIVITGKAKDLEPQDIMTVVTSDLFSDIDTEAVTGGDLDGQVNMLDDAACRLMEGTGTLCSGLEMLSDGSSALAEGAGRLDSGAQTLSESTGKALAGAGALSAGTQQFSQALESGLTQMKDAASALQKGNDQIRGGLAQINAGLDGSGTASDPGLVNAAGALAQGVKGTADAVNMLSGTLSADRNTIDAMKGVIGSSEMSDETREQLNGYISALESSITSDSTVLSQIDTAQLTGAAEGVSAGVSKIKYGIAGDGTEAAPGLIGGSEAMADGLAQLDSGLSKATGKTDSLTSNAEALASGAKDLEAGQQKICGGAAELAEGMSQLDSRSGDLISGVGRLTEGAGQLDKGMIQFYNDGIKKITDLYRNKLKGKADDIRNVIEAGKEYRTFTSLPDGMDGNVKFIYRTQIK